MASPSVLELRNTASPCHDDGLENAMFMDLHSAASLGCVSRVRELLESDASGVNLQNRGGWTPLTYAACSGQKEVLQLLLDHGAEVNTRNCHGRTAVIVAAMYGNHSCITLLHQRGADLEVRDQRDRTALFHASAFGQTSAVQLLVDLGANINCTEHFEGYNPLSIAASEHQEGIVEILLNAGSRFTRSSGVEGSPIRYSYAELIDRSRCSSQDNLTRRCGGLTLDPPKTTQQKSPYGSLNIPPRELVLDLADFLRHLGLSKYHQVFEKQGVDLETFLTFGDTQLIEAGIVLVGPRRKMAVAISRWNEREEQYRTNNKTVPRP